MATVHAVDIGLNISAISKLVAVPELQVRFIIISLRCYNYKLFYPIVCALEPINSKLLSMHC